jgi:23S rRNA pseudouridine2605 synthase
MALAEGKNREVRRICEHLGWQVNRLIRVAYGPFQLGLLEPGGVEEVSARVVKEQMGDSGARPATAAEKRRQREAAHDEKRRQKREEARAAEQRTLRPGKRERAARWGKSGEAAGRPESKPQGGRPAAARGDLPSPGKAGFGKAGLPSPGKAGFGKAGLPSPGKAGFGKAGRPFGKPGRAIAKPGQAGGAGFEPRDRAQRGKRGERRLERIEESFETREARSFTPREGHGKASRPSPRAGGAQGAPDQPRLNKDRRRKPGGGPTKPGHAHRRRPS